MQLKCGPGNIIDVLEKREREEAGEKGKGREREQSVVVSEKTAPAHSPSTRVGPASPPVAPAAAVESQKRKKSRPSWRAGLRKVYLAVPAFASPLTPVLNPLMRRAQWEIVVRSAAVSAVLSCVIVGGLLGVPER